MSDTTVTITSETLEYMADRIEELEANLAEQIEWVKQLADDLIAAEGREARLKEKLAKAVEVALEECQFRSGTPKYDNWWRDRRATITELTGGKDAE